MLTQQYNYTRRQACEGKRAPSPLAMPHSHAYICWKGKAWVPRLQSFNFDCYSGVSVSLSILLCTKASAGACLVMQWWTKLNQCHTHQSDLSYIESSPKIMETSGKIISSKWRGDNVKGGDNGQLKAPKRKEQVKTLKLTWHHPHIFSLLNREVRPDKDIGMVSCWFVCLSCVMTPCSFLFGD